MVDYSFYLIADDHFVEVNKMIETIVPLLDHGISCLQLRMKNTAPEKILQTGKMLLPFLREKNIPLLLNDQVEIAQMIDADGVHIGQQDMTWQKARDLLGPDKIIGLSIENMAQAKQFAKADVNYFGVGPVYATLTKPETAPALGLKKLREISEILPKPVVAIGGITKNNVIDVLRTGVSGVAIISAIFSQACPLQAVKNFQNLIYKM